MCRSLAALSRRLRQQEERLDPFVLVVSRWLAKVMDEAPGGFLVQRTDHAEVLGEVGSYVVDVELGFGLYEPHFGQ